MPRDHIPDWAGARSITDPFAVWRERVAALERERDEAQTVIDRLDCTHREGGSLRHCRHDHLCLRCQRDEARASEEALCDSLNTVLDAAGIEMADTYADTVRQIIRERDDAKHLAAVFGCRDDYRHTEDECPLCRAEAALASVVAELEQARALLRKLQGMVIDHGTDAQIARLDALLGGRDE